MCRLHLDPTTRYANDTLLRLSSNSPGGLLFTKLESLEWGIASTQTALPFFRLFLSPHLQSVTITIYLDVITEDMVAPLTQMISLLPISLRHLSIMCDQEGERLSDAMSSFVCRSGSLLSSFETTERLSEKAIDHLMQLPNLSRWVTVQGPPRVVPTSIFPSLESIWLHEPTALPWLHLLASHERDILWQDGSRSATSHPNIRETLTSFRCFHTIVDSTLLSSVVKFRNLVTLCVDTTCPNTDDCTFFLTDGHMEDLAAALPRLEDLKLGYPCHFNSCATTIASLASISVHCPDLTVLQVHFNTRTIVSDMQRLLDGVAGRGKAKCKLRNLSVGFLPLEVGEEDVKNVTVGLKVIFPCLTDLEDFSGTWYKPKSIPEDRGR